MRPRKVRWVVWPSVVRRSYTGTVKRSRRAGNVETVKRLLETACDVWKLMGVGEVIDVSAAVVHVVRPKLRFTVSWWQLDNFARIFVDRVITLDFKCDMASFFLLILGKKCYLNEIFVGFVVFTSGAFSFSGLFKDDLLGINLWSQHDGTQPSSADSSSDSFVIFCSSFENLKVRKFLENSKKTLIYLHEKLAWLEMDLFASTHYPQNPLQDQSLRCFPKAFQLSFDLHFLSQLRLRLCQFLRKFFQ